MTNEYYNDLNSYLFSLVTKNEIIKTSMWGENSQFIRLNNSKVRQTGIVNDLSYSIVLISNKRQVSCSLTINGRADYDKNLLKTILQSLRDDIKNVPEDPYIVYPKSDECTEQKNGGELLNFDNASQMLLPAMQGVDLTGIWASGLIYTGVANSLGQSHWFETETFSLDYSFWPCVTFSVILMFLSA